MCGNISRWSLAGWKMVGVVTGGGCSRVDGGAVLSDALSSSSGVPCLAPSGVEGSPRRRSAVGVSGGDVGLGSDNTNPRTCRLSAALIRPGSSSRPTLTSPRYIKSISAATSWPGKSFSTITGCLQGCSANILSKNGLQFKQFSFLSNCFFWFFFFFFLLKLF